MQYSTIVEKNEESLQMIISAAEKFEEGKYLEGISKCRLNKHDVLCTIEFVKEYMAKLSREYLALANFASTFNKQYATKNNSCFESAELLFNRIRSTISGSKKIYKRFCKTIRKRLAPTVSQNPSVFKRSELVNDYYSEQLFGMESYDECVRKLYDELERFFMKLVKCLAFCRMIITEENEIRSTPDRCVTIYKDCYEQMLNNNKMMVRTFKENKILPPDEFEERRKKANSLQDFICKNYHVLDPSQFQMHVVSTEIKRGMTDGLTETEIKLYGSDSIEHVEKVRLVIEHFDELETDGHKGKHEKKHSSYCVASFMLWSGIGKNQDNKVKAFVDDYFNKTYKGNYPPVKTNAVNTAKNNILYGQTNFQEDKFRIKIERLIMTYSTKGVQNQKKVVNF